MKKFRERRPSFCSGFENMEYDVNSLDDVLELEWCKNFKTDGFYSFARCDDSLMTVNNFNSETGKCKNWWVIGSLIGFSEKEYEEFGLKNYTELIERN